MEEQCSGPGVPDPEGRIGSGAGEAFAVGAERQAGHARLHRVVGCRLPCLEREPDVPVGGIPELDATAPLDRGDRPSVGAEGDLADLAIVIAERQSLLMGEPVQIMPLPPAEVGFALAGLHRVEQEAEPADVIAFPGGEREVRTGRVQGLAQLFLGASQPFIGPGGVVVRRGLVPGRGDGGHALHVGLRPFLLGRLQRVADLEVRPDSQSQQAGQEQLDQREQGREPRPAPRRLDPRSQNNTGRATIGSSARNRLRSSPIASADWYRAPGSFSIAFKTIVSRSRGIWPSSARGRRGSAVLICSIRWSRSEAPNPERSVSSS